MHLSSASRSCSLGYKNKTSIIKKLVMCLAHTVLLGAQKVVPVPRMCCPVFVVQPCDATKFHRELLLQEPSDRRLSNRTLDFCCERLVPPPQLRLATRSAVAGERIAILYPHIEILVTSTYYHVSLPKVLPLDLYRRLRWLSIYRPRVFPRMPTLFFWICIPSEMRRIVPSSSVR